MRPFVRADADRSAGPASGGVHRLHSRWLAGALAMFLCCAGASAVPGASPQLSNWPVEGITSEQPEELPRPELVPLPPALIPAAALLGWVIYQRRRRRRA